jgi:hypothetical protein
MGDFRRRRRQITCRCGRRCHRCFQGAGDQPRRRHPDWIGRRPCAASNLCHSPRCQVPGCHVFRRAPPRCEQGFSDPRRCKVKHSVRRHSLPGLIVLAALAGCERPEHVELPPLAISLGNHAASPRLNGGIYTPPPLPTRVSYGSVRPGGSAGSTAPGAAQYSYTAHVPTADSRATAART